MPVERNSKINILRRIHLFRNLEDQKLEVVADLMEEVTYPDQQAVFRTGEDPDYFYVIYSGRVKISRYLTVDKQWQTLGVLESGDYFGHEVLESDWARQVTAEAEGEAVLLRLSVPAFQQVIDMAPHLGQALQMVLDSFRLMLNTRFNWLENNEYIYYIARQHVLFMVLKLLPPLLVGVLIIPVLLFFALSSGLVSPMLIFGLVTLVLVGWLAWAYVDWTNDYYIITKSRVIYQERVILLYDSRQEAPLEAVQSISTNTTQIGRILGYGNVVVRTYFGTILFKEVFSSENVMALLQDRQYYAQVVQVYEEMGQIKKRLSGRIASGPKLPNPPKPPARPAIPPSATQQFLATMFHQRYEVSGTIIYRTHWFILLKKIFLPAVLLLGLGTLFLISGYNRFPVLPFQSTCGLTTILGLGLFGWLGYQYLDWHNDVYLITPDQIADVNKKPLGREERRSAQLSKIQNIEYQRIGIIGLLLNYGTVYIQVGDQKLTFDEVFKPADVQRELFHALSRRTKKDRDAQMESDRQRLADWIASYHDLMNK